MYYRFLGHQNQQLLAGNNSDYEEWMPSDYFDPNVYDEVSPLSRLIDYLLDTTYYEKTVHPRRDFKEATKIDLRMSLYQILEVVCLGIRLPIELPL